MIHVVRATDNLAVEMAFRELEVIPAWQIQLAYDRGLGLYVLDHDTRASYIGLCDKDDLQTGDDRTWDDSDMAWFDSDINTIVIYRQLLFQDEEFKVMRHEFAHALDWMLGNDSWFTESEAFDRYWKRGTPLDRYAATNPLEYFAQGYEASFREERVPCEIYYEHTRAGLARRDPELFALISSMEQQEFVL